jgi:hypothetical protein
MLISHFLSEAVIDSLGMTITISSSSEHISVFTIIIREVWLAHHANIFSFFMTITVDFVLSAVFTSVHHDSTWALFTGRMI